MRFYPVFANLNGRRCLAVGKGDLIEEKSARLRECGALVRRRDIFNAADAQDTFLIVADVDGQSAERIREYGDSHRIFVNIVDKLEYCSFILPAVVRQDELLIAISTSGQSPALAGWIRERLQQEFGPEYKELVNALGSTRDTVKKELKGYASRKTFYRNLLDSGILQIARREGKEAARIELTRQLQLFKKRGQHQTKT